MARSLEVAASLKRERGRPASRWPAAAATVWMAPTERVLGVAPMVRASLAAPATRLSLGEPIVHGSHCSGPPRRAQSRRQSTLQTARRLTVGNQPEIPCDISLERDELEGEGAWSSMHPSVLERFRCRRQTKVDSGRRSTVEEPSGASIDAAGHGCARARSPPPLSIVMLETSMLAESPPRIAIPALGTVGTASSPDLAALLQTLGCDAANNIQLRKAVAQPSATIEGAAENPQSV